MRRRLITLAAGCLVAMTGCAAVPDSGPVHLGRALPAPGGVGDASDVDVKALPPPWRPGLAPDAVVAGFLHALINSDGDYAIARSYLTDAAAEAWDPSRGITTYDDSTLSLDVSVNRASAVVHVRAARVGHADARGDYEPLPGAVDLDVAATRTGQDWRIEHLPDGVLLSAIDAQRALRLARVYYLSHDGHRLVPEQTLLPATRSGLATALVRTLLAGPGSWLAPAVARTIPPGTTLLGNVPIDPSGTADVNMSTAVRQASPTSLRALSAQIVWTLRQVSDITAVRLLADGSLLGVPGLPARQRVTAWPQFDPDAAAAFGGLALVRDGRVVPGPAAPAALARIGSGVVSVAQSADGKTVAVVRRLDPSRVALMTGPVGGSLQTRLVASSFTAPSFAPTGEVVAVATTGRTQSVVEVLASGTVRPVVVDGSLSSGGVLALRLSRDGARVAAVVSRAGGTHLLVGRVAGTRDAPAFGAFHDILPGARDVRGVAWMSGDEVAVTVAVASGRTVVTTDVDGYASHPVAADGLEQPPVDVTAIPGQPLVVVSTAGDVWALDQRWHRLGTGSAAAYAG